MTPEIPPRTLSDWHPPLKLLLGEPWAEGEGEALREEIARTPIRRMDWPPCYDCGESVASHLCRVCLRPICQDCWPGLHYPTGCGVLSRDSCLADTPSAG